MTARVALGLLVTLVLELALFQLVSSLHLTDLPAPELVLFCLVSFLSVFAGAKVSRSDFLWPALGFWLVFTVALLGLIHYLGVGLGGTLGFSELISLNMPASVATLVGTVAAATLARRLHVRTPSHPG